MGRKKKGGWTPPSLPTPKLDTAWCFLSIAEEISLLPNHSDGTAPLDFSPFFEKEQPFGARHFKMFSTLAGGKRKTTKKPFKKYATEVE